MAIKKYFTDEEKRRAHVEANMRYNANTYTRIILDVRPEFKERVQNAADQRGISIRAYVISAIENALRMDEG